MMSSVTNLLLYTSTAAACYIAVPALAKLYRNKVLVPKFSAVQDLEEVGKARKKAKLKGQVVVCGGSVAGLLAAAIAYEHYESVLIIEAEEGLVKKGSSFPSEDKIRITPEGIPTHVNPRSRVMQYTSTHAFMPVCFRTLRRLFPSYYEEVAKLGLKEYIHKPDFHLAGILLQGIFDEGVDSTILYITRETFEILVRRLVMKDMPGIRFVDGTVTGIQRSPDGKSIDELYWRASRGASQTIPVPKLVIDATGTSQAGLKWLNKAGFTIPATLRIQYQVPLHYVTTLLRVPAHLRQELPLEERWEDTYSIYTYLPDLTKETGFFTFFVLEQNKILICCGGWGDLPRPHSIDEIREYILQIRPQKPINPRVFELLDFFEEHISELNPSYDDASMNTCSYVQYHQLAEGALPQNFVAMGDSVMQLNPIFGQGITKAAVDALTLDSTLRETDESNASSLPSRFFNRLAGRHEFGWNSNKDSDYGLSFTTPIDGEDLSVGWFSRWYGGYVMKLALKDRKVADSAARVRSFAAPHTDLMAPSILMRVLWMWLTRQ
ncbi:hypothetical protein FRC02_011180 [Tulasnella sp. 418]|nr:hypothetical protein FRC02_011180 [Tulasnella sp. 418]